MSEFDADPGETLVDNDGPVVCELDSYEIGGVALDTTVDTLRAAVTERLPDDYPSVHLCCDGRMLVATDHASPMSGERFEQVDAYEPGVHRAKVVGGVEETQRAIVDREYLTAALDALDGDAVTVHVMTDRPVIVDDGERAVAVCPRVKPGQMEADA